VKCIDNYRRQLNQKFPFSRRRAVRDISTV
jgi:hypothetical protein